MFRTLCHSKYYTHLTTNKLISYDNTQKIIINDQSLEGTVKVYVRRDNTLTGGSQNFSLAVSLDAETVAEDLTVNNIYLDGKIISNGGDNKVTLQTDYGYVQCGPTNSTTCHFRTDRSSFYFSKGVISNGFFKSYRQDFKLYAQSQLAITAKESNGNVGIKKSNATQALDVNGYVNAKGYFDFTGMHEYPVAPNVDKNKFKKGLIVATTGNLSPNNNPYINLTSHCRQKSLVGVFVSFDTENGLAQISSLGDGSVLVISPLDKNGCATVKIENGDYITSSNVPGYGIKQCSNKLMNYTVGKIVENCSFAKNDKDCFEITYKCKKYRAKEVRCIYTC